MPLVWAAWAAWVTWAWASKPGLQAPGGFAEPQELSCGSVSFGVSHAITSLMSLPAPEKVTALVRQAAAELVLPRFRKLREEEIREKTRGDLVTVADEEVEDFLSDRLIALLPGSVVVGEEATERKPEGLDELATQKPVWIIDPVDGTTNFARGNDRFAVMVALAEQGTLQSAWIYAPVQNILLQAQAGKGAWINEERLPALEPVSHPRQLIGSLHFGSHGSPELLSRFERNRSKLSTLKSLRCAGHEYIRLARGESSFSLFTRTKPWDHAPGVLIYQELGGHARHLPTGQAYDIAESDPGPLLLAPDASSWDSLRDSLLSSV